VSGDRLAALAAERVEAGPHGHAQRFEYGEFGDLAMLLEEMGRT